MLIFFSCVFGWLLVGLLTAYSAHAFLEPDEDWPLGDVLKLSIMGPIVVGFLLAELYSRSTSKLFSRTAFKGKRK